MAVANYKPHAVCLPMPFQGHITPLLQFAKLLHHRGIHITFVNTEFNHKRLLKSRGPDSLNGLPDFHFETIPDGLPPLDDPDANQDMGDLYEASQKNFLAPFRHLLVQLNNTAASGVPPVTCIITDGLLSSTFVASQELGLLHVLFWAFSPCGLMAYRQNSHLTEGDYAPPEGMEDAGRSDIPNLIRIIDPNDYMLEFTKGEAERASKASAVVFCSFHALEKNVLDALSSVLPHVYSIGPLQFLLNSIPDNGLKSTGSNLRKEETECVQWLNSKEPQSVIYVNFGSLIIVTPQQLVEFAWGLANSNHFFLWIIREDLVVGESAILPPEFLTETKGRGLIANWCPQEQVLNHSSIGGFLTHSGSNSTIESICSGVPMICWPFFPDQVMNCRYACKEWGIGMQIDNDVKRDEVEKLVRDLMEGEKGKKMRNKAMEWKQLAEEATGPNGSSSLNLDKLVNEVLLLPKNQVKVPLPL